MNFWAILSEQAKMGLQWNCILEFSMKIFIQSLSYKQWVTLILSIIVYLGIAFLRHNSLKRSAVLEQSDEQSECLWVRCNAHNEQSAGGQIAGLTPLFPMHPFSTPWKWCFQWLEKEYIGNNWLENPKVLRSAAMTGSLIDSVYHPSVINEYPEFIGTWWLKVNCLLVAAIQPWDEQNYP